MVVIGLGAALTAYNHWQEQRAWREACAEADHLDAGWRWDDLAAAWPSLPDERNSVVRIRAAAKVAPELTQFRGSYAEYAQLLPQHRPSPQLVAELRAFVTAAGPVLADVLALADYPEGRIVPPTRASQNCFAARRRCHVSAGAMSRKRKTQAFVQESTPASALRFSMVRKTGVGSLIFSRA